MRKVSILLLLCILAWSAAQQTSMKGLKVVKNKIMNEDDKIVVLRGVNRPGTEYSCVQYSKIFDGPVDKKALSDMKSWKINAVRVPINEDCWLGTGNTNPAFAGENYKSAVTNYVNDLTGSELAVIVDLHWTASTSGSTATQQTPMPDLEKAPTMWIDVANTFKTNSGIIFDIFNEPYPDNNTWDSVPAWTCWKTGNCPFLNYQAAGMQNLVNAIRGTGSQNIIMIGGIQYATSLVHWLDYKPTDPSNNLAAAVHVYDFNFCRSRGCWDIYWKPIMDQVPLIAGEAGETDCASEFINDFMNYADTNGIHYFMWAWLPSDCATGPSLISDFSGTPTNYGQGLKTHLDQLSRNKVPAFLYSFPIFVDGRSHWVDDWSSKGAIIAMNESKVVHSGVYSIMYQPTVNMNLYFQCWGCINTTIHRGIQFWINGGANRAQDVKLVLVTISDKHLIAAGQSATHWGPVIDINNITTSGITANKWVKAYLDLSTVPEGVYDGIQVVAFSAQPTIYLDDIYVYDKRDNAGVRLGAAGWILVLVCFLAMFLGL